MDQDPEITLRIPQAREFNTRGSPNIAVPAVVVDCAIDVLQGFVVQWKQNEGSEQIDEIWDLLAEAAAHALGGLMAAWAAYYHGDKTHYLVEHIARFLQTPDPARYREEELRGLRRDPERGYIADALIALLQESERRRKERAEQRDTPRQEPETKDEAGWEF
jgi:hypothetical protein